MNILYIPCLFSDVVQNNICFHFSGNIVFTSSSVFSQLTQCLDFANQMRPPATRAKYFYWNQDSKACILYDSPKRTCATLSGPKDEDALLTEECSNYINDNSDCSSLTLSSCQPSQEAEVAKLPGISDPRVCESICDQKVSKRVNVKST